MPRCYCAASTSFPRPSNCRYVAATHWVVRAPPLHHTFCRKRKKVGAVDTIKSINQQSIKIGSKERRKPRDQIIISRGSTNNRKTLLSYCYYLLSFENIEDGCEDRIVGQKGYDTHVQAQDFQQKASDFQWSVRWLLFVFVSF